MNAKPRFHNPMLDTVRRRRFVRFGRAGRVSTHPYGSGGTLLTARSASLHGHRHLTINRSAFSPVFNIALRHNVLVNQERARDRIETRVLREPGLVRELLIPARSSERESRHDGAPETEARSIRDLAETTVERVMRHRRRIESRHDTTVVMRAARAVTAEAIERAIERIAPAQLVAESNGMRPDSQSPAGPLSAPSLPDLDRLTDQIVSRIDDRLIAHRERMGTLY